MLLNKEMPRRGLSGEYVYIPELRDEIFFDYYEDYIEDFCEIIEDIMK